jgi:hypothetical protein
MRKKVLSGILFCSIIFLFLPICLIAADDRINEPYSGVDETVVEKITLEHGRKPSGPLLPLDQGDVPLFLFLDTGAAGDFAA